MYSICKRTHLLCIWRAPLCFIFLWISVTPLCNPNDLFLKARKENKCKRQSIITCIGRSLGTSSNILTLTLRGLFSQYNQSTALRYQHFCRGRWRRGNSEEGGKVERGNQTNRHKGTFLYQYSRLLCLLLQSIYFYFLADTHNTLKIHLVMLIYYLLPSN